MVQQILNANIEFMAVHEVKSSQDWLFFYTNIVLGILFRVSSNICCMSSLPATCKGLGCNCYVGFQLELVVCQETVASVITWTAAQTH